MLADEATDCSNVEQLAIVLRFVDESLKIREEFLGFVPCRNGLSGEAIAEEISTFLSSIDLSLDDCRGQGYDGAGNMAVKLSGVAVRIQKNHEKAIYVHCGAHILNLCVASSCQLEIVRDMMGNVRAVSDFFNNSPKRVIVLEQKIKELLPDAQQQKLLNVCRTRWVARINGLALFKKCYIAILPALQEISKDMSNEQDVRYRASGMREAIKKFQFIVSLVLVESCLKCTKPLTLQLQSASIDAGKAREKASLLYLKMNELRTEIDATHTKFYEEAVSIAEKVNVKPLRPRTTPRQVHRESVPANSSSEYFKRAVTIPFLDEIIGQIHTRFSEGNLD
mgnify:FL=1